MHQQLETAVKKGGRSAQLFRDLGASLEWLQQPRQAIDAYTKGLELAADDATLRVMRAWAKLSVGDADGAVKDFEYVAQKHPGLGYLRADSATFENLSRHYQAKLTQTNSFG